MLHTAKRPDDTVIKNEVCENEFNEIIIHDLTLALPGF